MSALRLAVLGATGRMGRAVVRLAPAHGAEVVLALAGPGDAAIGRDAGELAGIGPLGVPITALGEADRAALARSRAGIVIDFSAPAALAEVCGACADASVALVSGTTGIDADAQRRLDALATRVPVLWEPNMSVGIAVLAKLVGDALRALGPSFDVEIVEAHHRAKVDSPSGTALRLAEVARAATGGELRHGRQGQVGPRAPSEIGVHAVRGGDVIGDHTVHLLGASERLELTHRASSRDLFADGALRAAARLAGRAPGRYRLADLFEA